MHWAEGYTSTRYAYVECEFDCADLIRLVQSEVFSREIELPGSRDYAGKRGHAKQDAMVAQIGAVKDDYARRTEAPEEGDGVLLIARGKPSHIGVYCVINGEAWVLHNSSSGKRPVLQRLRELDRYGLAVEGFYRWI